MKSRNMKKSPTKVGDFLVREFHLYVVLLVAMNALSISQEYC